jgi:hypothetical protein
MDKVPSVEDCIVLKEFKDVFKEISIFTDFTRDYRVYLRYFPYLK